MNIYIALTLSLAVFIAGVIGLFKFKFIDPKFHPFLYCIWLACLNETVSIFLILNKHTTNVNHNFYVLFEPLLFLWFFVRNGLFLQNKGIPLFLASVLILLWLGENVFFASVDEITYLYRISYSLIIVLLSVNLLSRLLLKSISKQNRAVFLLCVSFIIFFSYEVIVDVFWAYGSNSQSSFLLNLYLILIYVNLFTNLLYALAVVWMPKKRGFTLPS